MRNGLAGGTDGWPRAILNALLIHMIDLERAKKGAIPPFQNLPRAPQVAAAPRANPLLTGQPDHGNSLHHIPGAPLAPSQYRRTAGSRTPSRHELPEAQV